MDIIVDYCMLTRNRFELKFRSFKQQEAQNCTSSVNKEWANVESSTYLEQRRATGTDRVINGCLSSQNKIIPKSKTKELISNYDKS